MEEETVVSLKNLKLPVEEPPLTEFDKLVIGKAKVRILMPVTNMNDLLKYADLMAGLVEEIRFQARRTDGPGYESARFPKFRREQFSIIRQTAHAVAESIRRIDLGLKDEDA